jgi:hypothetical protein
LLIDSTKEILRASREGVAAGAGNCPSANAYNEYFCWAWPVEARESTADDSFVADIASMILLGGLMPFYSILLVQTFCFLSVYTPL